MLDQTGLSLYPPPWRIYVLSDAVSITATVRRLPLACAPIWIASRPLGSAFFRLRLHWSLTPTFGRIFAVSSSRAGFWLHRDSTHPDQLPLCLSWWQVLPRVAPYALPSKDEQHSLSWFTRFRLNGSSGRRRPTTQLSPPRAYVMRGVRRTSTSCESSSTSTQECR